jgi:hypothetical protein
MTAMNLVIGSILLLALPAWAAKIPQIEPGHMRAENHDTVLNQAIAWQQEMDKQWVTFVLVTDRPIPPASVGPDKSTDNAMETAKAQGIGFVVGSGGLPIHSEGFRIWFRDGAGKVQWGGIVTGDGGFEIDSQSATRIKGRATMDAVGDQKEPTAWSVSFDAPVTHGDAKRMLAEGEPLDPTGGQPAKDLAAAQQARRTGDYAAILAYAAPDVVAFLADPVKRPKNLQLIQDMAPPKLRILGGLRQGDKVKIYWRQLWPDALDNRCVDEMELQGGKWRTVASSCTSE